MTPAERAHCARIRSLPCCRCGWPGPSEAHHVGHAQGQRKCPWALIPLCETTIERAGCHRGKSGADNAPDLTLDEELGHLKDTLETVWEKWGPDYAEYVRERLRTAWAKRLALRSGHRYREVLE